MKTKFRSFNDLFCTFAMEEFSRLGVENIFIAPGSRSTPLVFAAEENAKLKKHIHFDERGMAFMALGCAKKTNRPVVLITTSGTAAANLYPAIIEADLTHVPLIVCTGDRPFELRDTGANQAINQTEMFNHVIDFYDIPCPSSHVPLESVLTTLDSVVTKATSQNGGPIHLNWMFQEPLTPPLAGEITYSPSKQIQNWMASSKCYSQEFAGKIETPVPEHIKGILKNAKNGLIVVGAQGANDLKAEHFENLPWPVFFDIQSSLRLQNIKNSVAHWDLVLEIQNLKPDCVVWLGGAVTNRKGLEFFKDLGCPIIQVQPFNRRLDPHHLSKLKLVGSGETILRELQEATRSSDFELLLSLEQKISSFLEKEFEKESPLSEPDVAFEVSRLFKEENLFLASSRPIRDFQRFATIQSTQTQIFSNRGASGIDGNIATIAGLALASKERTVGVVGDLAALHDINSLSLVAQSPSPILLIIINNDGGGIFSFLPVSLHKEVFDKYWGTPHGYDFQNFAKGFGVGYMKIKTKAELIAVLDGFKTTTVLEVESNREDNFACHQRIVEKLKNSLL